MHNMSLRSKLASHVQFMDNKKLFVYLSDLGVRIHFDVVDIFCRTVTRWKVAYRENCQRNVPDGTLNRTYRDALNRGYFRTHAPVGELAILRRDWDTEINARDRQKKWSTTPLFQVTRWVAIQPSTEASVSIMASSVELIDMKPHLNLIWNRMFLSASGIVNTLLHVSTTRQATILTKTRHNYPMVY